MSQLTVQQGFDIALQHHRAGRLQQAEQFYRQILVQQPTNAGALHYLGVIAYLSGRNEMAVQLIRRASALNPGDAEIQNSLGNACRAGGRLDEAIAAFGNAAALKPDYAEAYSNLGAALAMRGRWDDAIAAFRKVIAINPSLPEVHNNLGKALRDLGQPDQSIEACRQAISLKPDMPKAHYNLGAALADLGRFEEAVVAFRQVIALNPKWFEAHCNLGVALKDGGRFDEAITVLREAIALNPNVPEVHSNLGNVLRAEGRLDEAIAAFRQAITLDPNLAEAYYNLGIALKDKGRLDDAIAATRRAVVLKPSYAEAHNNLGNFYKAQGSDDLAERHCRLAIQLKPELAAAYINLGALLEQAGDFQAAEDCYRQAIQRTNGDAICHSRLATLLGRDLPENDLEAIEELLADPSCSVISRACLQFAVAHVFDARDCYQEATGHMRIATTLSQPSPERRGQGYDMAAHAQFVGRMVETCSPGFFQRVQGRGLQTHRPVFVFGLPRSGTTLTEQILAGHSQVFGAGELPLGRLDFFSLAGESAEAPSLGEDLAFQELGRIDHQSLQSIARRHLLQLDKLNPVAARVVDKMPENYLYLGLLAALFPQASFIHCRRDLRDVAISCLMTQFESVPWSNDLEHITSRIEQYRRIMQHWATVLPGRWLDCDYEQTVADLPGTARRLIAWCGLEWEPACVEFHQLKRPIRTASVTQVRRPIFNRSVGRWRHYQELLAPVLARLA